MSRIDRFVTLALVPLSASVAFLLPSSTSSFTTTALPVTVSPPVCLSSPLDPSPVSETASFASRDPSFISPPEAEESSCPPRGHQSPRRSSESRQLTPLSVSHSKPTPTSPPRSLLRQKNLWTPSSILRPPAVRLANPVNYVPRITPVAVPQPFLDSNESLPLEAHRDAYPLLSIPEQRRSRLTPSPNSLLVERSQGETESGRSSIAVPRAQTRSGIFDDNLALQDMPESAGHRGSLEANNIRPPERAHQTIGPVADDRPRHIQSQISLRSQAQIAAIPSSTGVSGENDVAEELAWGPAHPCYPHLNPHVSAMSQEYHTTRIIRIRRDWMVKGDLAPTFSNLYPEILDPLLPEQEFRKIIATVNHKLIRAFDPFSFRNCLDGVLAFLTGWLWEDIGATGVKSQLKQVEKWLETWNREVGSKDGVYIWSLRQTAYMSLDIQIPDPKVGIIPSEGRPSLPGTRPSSGVGR
ncbi:Golgin subfamily A member 7/ERF4 family-domain-containing protein [Aspergillus coremiiformis]|uniref:Ras modification protein ERF4 n=1 Tax=Aspergillus coremiiformis TaxID=138285 RepID=A0A5N6YWN0_9EURO|nr:Golgin subfamily A member 7/ERF4 family-domain-containing protein [Aspergillus coremiiformis]